MLDHAGRGDSLSHLWRHGQDGSTRHPQGPVTPAALATLDPGEAHRFCPDPACDVVYFSASGPTGRRR
ncbi:hypothetical protein ACFOLM_21310 [Deinococcus soli (ex Cha et al. 2016)]|uniref:hypothetical protein n=1 Tax=Deinococcus soli (ex Cha et al. 2016) TaxID=1309411 RepID=UPI0036185AFB